MLQSSRLVLPSELSDARRPIRLRLGRGPEVITDHLMVKRISGDAAMCGGFEYRLLCVAAQAGLPLKGFGALAAELQFVTDRGLIHSVCGIVARADEGESDGGLATYQLVIRDALALMESRVNTRVFRAASEVEITRIVLTEWTRNNPALACAFDFALPSTVYPAREFTMQYNESDAAFLRRLWKRRGLAWFFETAEEDGDDGVRRQRLVVFDDARKLGQSSAGTVRYHRDDGTEERDSVTAWHACRNLSPGSVSRRSWDYKRAGAAEIAMPARLAQGDWGDRYAAGVEEYLVDSPHVSDDAADFDALAKRRMEFHEYAAKFFLGESGVRDLAVGRWVAMEGHPEISRHPPAEREFVITELHVEAENNLPKSLNDKIARLFALNRWPLSSQGLEHASAERDARYANNFRCVRRGVPIVPSFDPRVDVPRAQAESVVVVAPEGEVVHCDEWGRVKVRFPACRAADHSHAQAAGGTGGESDSAWIRVASTWAGDRFGVVSLPRAGEECIVTFLGGDPDKPVITGRVHGAHTMPPEFSKTGSLPGNRFLSGMRSREVAGERYNQLRLDDTAGQISAQLASEHAHTQLNLGHLRHPRRDGDALPRGEGAELRSDAHVAVRAAKGMLLTAWKRLNAADTQLARAEFLALVQECLEQCQTLGQYASSHQGAPFDAAPLEEMASQLKG